MLNAGEGVQLTGVEAKGAGGSISSTHEQDRNGCYQQMGSFLWVSLKRSAPLLGIYIKGLFGTSQMMRLTTVLGLLSCFLYDFAAQQGDSN